MPTFIKVCFAPKAKPEGKVFKAVEFPRPTWLTKPEKQRVRSSGSYITILIALLLSSPTFKMWNSFNIQGVMLGDPGHWGERTQGDRNFSFQLSLRGMILQRNSLNLLKPPVGLSGRGSGVVRAAINSSSNSSQACSQDGWRNQMRYLVESTFGYMMVYRYRFFLLPLPCHYCYYYCLFICVYVYHQPKMVPPFQSRWRVGWMSAQNRSHN